MEFSVNIEVKENGRKAPKYTLESDINGEVTLETLFAFTKGALQTIAYSVLSEEQAKGFPKNPVTLVDGDHNKKIENVFPLGRIEFLKQVELDKILLLIYETLLERSPVLTGAYKSSHVVSYNGKQIANSMDSLKSWLKSNPDITDKDKIRFVDTQFYAGKLERYGKTNENQGGDPNYREVKRKDKKTKLPMMVKKPNGAYYIAARTAKRLYGKNVYITFEWQPGANLGLPKYANARHDYVYPTILVYIFKSGLQ